MDESASKEAFESPPTEQDPVRELSEAEAAAEFATLADNIPTLCWMARADGHIYWYNRRWYEYTGTSVDDQQGWGWESVHDPLVLPTVVERWKHSLATGSQFEMTFPLRGADGSFRRFLTRIVPIRDEGGTIVRWFGTNTDVDELKRVESQLRARREELETLLSSAPLGLAFFDRNRRYVRVNQQLADINSLAIDEHIGRQASEVLGEENGAMVSAVIDQVFATGEPVGQIEISGYSPRSPDQLRHWLIGFYPVRSAAAEVVAVGAWLVEISDQKAAEQRELLLAREVDHRAKNLLAVVQSIVQLTPDADGPQLKASIVGRIQSLARAHSLLSDARWDGVVFGELVRDELAPFESEDGSRASFEGPHLLLRPAAAQSLGLVLHELATNAAKYGSLSNDAGKVRVEWRLEPGDGGFLIIEWTETGAPDPGEPEFDGFGSRIVRASVDRQLRGKVTKEWTSDGLRCTIRIPAAEVVPGSTK